MRYFLECAYLGKEYVGWQRQLNGISIQEEIEKSISTLFQKEIEINGSSRTDAGVHSKSQFAHFELENEYEDLDQLVFRLNVLLPDSISIKKIYKVTQDQHSRFDAISRSYIYRIKRQKNPFNGAFSLLFNKDLDIEKMNAACLELTKHTDFQCFSKVKTQVNNFNCSIIYAKWIVTNEGLEFHIKANRFLRGMVRAIVGTMLDIGTGKTSLEAFNSIILSKNRDKAGRNVPAHGLTLETVEYPLNYFKNG